jgi:PRTRC genetic system ThiF family protein
MATTLDTSFQRACTLALRTFQTLEIFIVGLGGNGGWLLPHVVRFALVLEARGKKVSIILVDPDIVEEKNIFRQNFCMADVHAKAPLHKSRVLTLRYGLTWAVDIAAVTKPFSPDLIDSSYTGTYQERLVVVVDCTDNAKARESIFQILDRNNSWEAPRYWVLSCGNFEDSGQILLGSTNRPEALQRAFTFAHQCQALPSPALQAPDLLIPRPEELADAHLSCEEMDIANTQGLMINPMVACEAAEYLLELLILGKLKRFATYFHLPSGRKSSSYITPEAVAQVIHKDATFFTTRIWR